MYKRISEFPNNTDELARPELAALSKVWLERKTELEKGGAYQEFLKKLQREWAIETGIIERLYGWDRGVTEVLIEQGIDSTLIAHQGGLQRSQADHVKNLIDDQIAIVEGLFSFVKGGQSLTEHFIRSMQAQFTAHQEYTEAQTPDGQIIQVTLVRGEYKKLPNNPRRPDGLVHEYCPWEFVKEEMEHLVRWYQEAEGSTPPEILSAWLHHRFTQIHPFQDGNGRVARALATLVFLKAGLFPLVIRDADRKQYIAALEAADAGELSGLVQLFAKRQRDSILAAIGLEQQVQQARYAEEIISAAIRALKERVIAQTERVKQVYRVADQLRATAFAQLADIAANLDRQLKEVTPSNPSPYHARADYADDNSPQKHYFYNQIVEIAKGFKYFANLERYRTWVRLSITTEETFELVVSFHGYGHGNDGIMVASAFTSQRVPREEGGKEPVNTQAVAQELFQFNYAEASKSTERRFKEWLENVIAIALAEWKRLLQA
ncbi:MAG: Fic family protein [Deltaproteobacteria bacterium]|nr:Fic family protein [Deltaproteobacteria bacterium]